MTRPLEDVKVLDLSRLLPGPYCSLLLSDMGAEVVKIEEPGHGDYSRWMPPMVDGTGAMFLALNRGKKSVRLDLRAEVSREAVRRLAARFDVVLESFRPGVMDRLGLGYESLSAANPRLIYCSISGYGQTGPLRLKAGHDLNYLALAGVVGAAGPKQGPPSTSPVQIADVAGGSYPAAVSILAALYQREKTGVGQRLDISMTDGALSMMIALLPGHLIDEAGLAPGELPLSGGMVNYQTYRTKDGRFMALGALEPKFWLRFLELVGRPELGSLISARGEQLEHARLEVARLFAERTRDEWTALLEGEDVCCEPVLEADEVVHHPAHLARGMIRELERPGGELVRTVVTPLPFGREEILAGTSAELSPLPAAPELGAHGVGVLAANGFSVTEIERLQAEGGL